MEEVTWEQGPREVKLRAMGLSGNESEQRARQVQSPVRLLTGHLGWEEASCEHRWSSRRRLTIASRGLFCFKKCARVHLARGRFLAFSTKHALPCLPRCSAQQRLRHACGQFHTAATWSCRAGGASCEAACLPGPGPAPPRCSVWPGHVAPPLHFGFPTCRRERPPRELAGGALSAQSVRPSGRAWPARAASSLFV